MTVPAQRRPGHAPRRHPRRRSPTTRSRGSLNEGRGTHPGDTRCGWFWYPRIGCAQRRPGHAPRRHLHASLDLSGIGCAQTKAGARTPATHRGGHPQGVTCGRSTKAGARTPATRAARGACPARPGSLNEGRGTHPGDTCPSRASGRACTAPLNEGRGTHPGDTRAGTTSTRMSVPAQRRPGHAPRRHLRRWIGMPRRYDRSTKAGARTPATLDAARRFDARTPALNEGRGTHPGDTPTPPLVAAPSLVRSTKAGARTPATRGHRPRRANPLTAAQRRPGHAPRRHFFLRRCRHRRHAHAQRRPGHAPRRHAPTTARAPPVVPRSTKAGARTPATLNRTVDVFQVLWQRSTKAGARTPATRLRPRPYCARGAAQRRPGHAPRRHARRVVQAHPPQRRSTKAGARTPATRTDRRRSASRAPPSLNEGRGTHPGDTSASPPGQSAHGSAQRRPGHAPRRHATGPTGGPRSRPTLNEGRGTHPGDTLRRW